METATAAPPRLATAVSFTKRRTDDVINPLDITEAELKRRQGPSLTISCAVDGSQMSDKSMATALSFFNSKRGDKFNVIHISDMSKNYLSKHLTPSHLKNFYVDMAHGARVAGGVHVKCVDRLTTNIPEGIAEAVTELGCDVLVMGISGYWIMAGSQGSHRTGPTGRRLILDGTLTISFCAATFCALKRAELTKLLIAERGFTAVVVESDWPDAARVNRYVRGLPRPEEAAAAAADVPAGRAGAGKTAGHKPGYDASAEEALSDYKRFPKWMWRNRTVVEFVEWLRRRNLAFMAPINPPASYLRETDPQAARVVEARYRCFDRHGADAQSYGLATSIFRQASCEEAVRRALAEVRRRVGGYREAPPGGPLAHEAALEVLWAHNSHLGDARHADSGWRRGQLNVGQLVREAYPRPEVWAVGFSTHTGHVTAADDWDEPARRKAGPRLQRAIGVVYRPDTELQSHYFEADLPRQFDLLVHVESTAAVHPLDVLPQPPRRGWLFGCHGGGGGEDDWSEAPAGGEAGMVCLCEHRGLCCFSCVYRSRWRDGEDSHWTQYLNRGTG
eukprot:XP_001699413.1 flagellar associated protein [Chlamydomonas reinhardtii]